jgi:protein-S-isoprenylcysteine O-methyltransferase Ste14
MTTINAWVTRVRNTKAYDIFVALPLMALFGLGAWRESWNILVHVRAIAGGTENLLGVLQMLAFIGSVVFSLLIIVMLLLRTLPRARAPGVLPRALAVMGTVLAMGFLYLQPVALPMWAQATVDVMIFGASVLEIIILLRLGKAFAIMAEARELVTSGPYAVVRHPLYVAEEIGILTMFIQFAGPLALALMLAHIAVQVARTFYEERVLTAVFPEYRAYKARTWRFIPHVV